jgi:hypothetical protein
VIQILKTKLSYKELLDKNREMLINDTKLQEEIQKRVELKIVKASQAK